MISKLEKNVILACIKSKDERMKISNMIDKCNKCDASSKITNTAFLDLNEKNIIESILNKEGVKYITYFPNKYCEKSMIFFLPEYMDAEDIDYESFISCIKICCKNMSRLKHKDFMGSIYSLGIKNEFIGDIFLTDNAGYVYLNKTVEDYVLDNLFKVSNQEAKCQAISLYSDEQKELKIDYYIKQYIVPSIRVDALLAEVYKLSRKESKDKIVAGDLFINSKECINPSEFFYENDIISFKKCGKLRVGKEIKKTKSGNICIEVKKYK